MNIEIFDDKSSFVHFACGVLSYFWLFIFIIFIFYEIIEHIYKAEQEKEANFFGDIVEFLIGLGAITLLIKCFGW